MATQSEGELENKLIEQLVQLGYKSVTIRDEDDLVANLKTQLEELNNIEPLSEKEFAQILNNLRKGSIYDKAKLLRQPKIDYTKDDGTVGYISLLNSIDWCKNKYQVTNQITINGKYKNRYDVTILINGLPLVQIELKRRGMELKEAFEQTNRYERHSYSAGYGLFNYIQLFVISNGVNTKYYANNKISARTFKQTFYWSDVDNQLVTQLKQFAYTFLDTCHLSKMICKYIVLNTTHEILMVLRPYQYYAVEAIVDRVQSSDKYGYIWHTTGSGKTLTSYKASQILTQLPDIAKVVFVVDRKDLDFQTTKEFNSFSSGSVDGTANTKKLVEQFGDTSTKLIVTTIQKLDVAINKAKYSGVMNQFQDKKLVFIFDECHRSQFGKTHQQIKSYFPKSQMFGFTGTPIFAENYSKNIYENYTTESLFSDCLHKYVITDAIRDENVLKFSIEYINTVKQKEGIEDINVEDIDRKEIMEAPARLEKIVDYIIANHGRKTHNRAFTAMFCVPSIAVLIQYYDLFKKRDTNLKIATIFSFQQNEEDKEAKGEKNFVMDSEEMTDTAEGNYVHSREKLDECIADYNAMFGSNFSTKDSQSFYNYYNDISKQVKSCNIDILIVVNMFLTGFDSPKLNTMYVDKNLNYHGLIQAFSRTNRVLNELKSQGNIVCFRNLKSATDDAITLFSNKDAISEVVMPPYEDYVEEIALAIDKLQEIVSTPDAVNGLGDEKEQLAFITAFRQVMRLLNKLTSFTEFDYDDLGMDEQTFNDYKSKYLDLYEKVKSDITKEKVSILDDVNFELELIRRDEINVAYIIQLLAKFRGGADSDMEKIKRDIESYLSTEVSLRSKRELIEQFMSDNLLQMAEDENIETTFYNYVDGEKIKAIEELSEIEDLDSKRLDKLIKEYVFTEKEPMTKDIIDLLNHRPALKERKSVAERITVKIKKFIETFINGL